MPSNALFTQERRSSETKKFDEKGKEISKESSGPAVLFLALILLIPVIASIIVPVISFSKEPTWGVFYLGVAFLALSIGIVLGVCIKMIASWPDFPMRIYLSSYFPLLLGVALVSLSENNNVKC